MAAFTLVVNYRNKKTGFTMTAAEDVVTISTNRPQTQAPPTVALGAMPDRFGGSMPGARATVQFLSTGAWAYHSVSGQVATDGIPVAANTPLTLTLQDGDIIYVLGTAVTLHALVVGP